MVLLKKSKKMKKISKHISYREATNSAYAKQFGIENKPKAKHIKNMELIAEKVFEPLREWVGGPIRINSMFRSEELNQGIKGSPRSSHLTGNAIDLTTMGKKTNLDFDQLIWEYYNGDQPIWLHVSYKSKKDNRKQVLVIKKRGVYYTWVDDCKDC